MNCSPSGILCPILYWVSEALMLWIGKAVSQFTLAYVETTPGRAHHPTCPWIEFPEDRRLLRHTSPSCWVWPTATVWSPLMNSNRPFLCVIIWCTARIITFKDLWENFCHATHNSSKLSLLIHHVRNFFRLIYSVGYEALLSVILHTYFHWWEINKELLLS